MQKNIFGTFQISYYYFNVKDTAIDINCEIFFTNTIFQFAEDATVGAATVESGVPKGCMGLDVGPKSNVVFADIISKAKLRFTNSILFC